MYNFAGRVQCHMGVMSCAGRGLYSQSAFPITSAKDFMFLVATVCLSIS